MSPEAVRAVFTNLRIDYSKALFKFASAIAVDGPHHPDQMIFDFWERWAKHDATLFYLYMLFKARHVDDCLLVDPALMKQQSTAILMPMERMEGFTGGEDMEGLEDDEEMEELRATIAHHQQQHHDVDLDLANNDGQAAKRMRLESSAIPVELTGAQGAIIRDTAVANYCQRKTFNSEMSFFLDMMDPSLTELIGENLQNHFMSNFETLLTTKMEDDYGDIIYN